MVYEYNKRKMKKAIRVIRMAFLSNRQNKTILSLYDDFLVSGFTVGS